MLARDWERLLGGSSIAKRLELAWLDDLAQEQTREDWLATWNDVVFDDSFHDECRRRLERCVPLAVGPSRSRRLSHLKSDMTLVADTGEPDTLFVSWSHAMPPMLWSRCDASVEAFDNMVTPYIRADAPPLVELPRTYRVAKPLGLQDRGLIERSVEFTELWLDDAFWCSAFDDDPWVGVEGPMNMLEQSAWIRDVSDELDGRFPSISWRALWSRGVLRVEQHPWGLWVFELRYAPANDAAVVRYVNDLTGAHFPEDLPTDLIASALRGDSLDSVVLEQMRADGADRLDQLALTCALNTGESIVQAAMMATLDELEGDISSLGALADLANRYKHRQVLYELARRTDGTELGDELRRFLTPRSVEPA